jgi:hypothetical protein
MLPSLDGMQGVFREYIPPEEKRLDALPSEGDLVRLCTGGPVLVVVGVSPPDVCLPTPPGPPPFGARIRVLYVDKRDRLSYKQVPYGALRRART